MSKGSWRRPFDRKKWDKADYWKKRDKRVKREIEQMRLKEVSDGSSAWSS